MNSTVEFFRETERGSPVLLREFKLRILVELVMQSSIFFPGLLCDDKKELDFSKGSLLKIVFVSLISFQLIRCVLRIYIFFQLGAWCLLSRLHPTWIIPNFTFFNERVNCYIVKIINKFYNIRDVF